MPEPLNPFPEYAAKTREAPFHLPGILVVVLGIVLVINSGDGNAADNVVKIADFSSQSMQGWEPKSFVGHTTYSFARVEGKTMLKAQSHQSASGLTRKIKVDLAKTPFLNWSWRVDNVLSPRDEITREGDDYPARVYVLVSGGIAFWKTRAPNYVWSSSMPQGATWTNAFTANARMLVVRSGSGETGQVLVEKRNVREDLKTYLDLDADEIHGVAIMTDTDNGGGHATAYYGDIYYTAQ